eukprot:CAMPEP_0114247678 /NCGR_PEP_ID=MMETSP0058-20121206/13152_1 /TAXON_ID=36894 /ORGANISM="Pyramimonas parkeae, CCMP726" /LENGTH=363 /DNA_ID=CAMNT_0001361003 /DNA_START=295 /DNA_END=1386 /DNA_ORIENTATION=+
MKEMIDTYSAVDCQCGPSAQEAESKWKKSDNKLVVLASEGTTGTRWITSQFESLCHIPFSQIVHENVAVETEGAPWIQQKLWIADTPVMLNFCNIFFSFPKAMIVQAMRPAMEWARKRQNFHKGLKRHRDEKWGLASVCRDQFSYKGLDLLRPMAVAVRYATVATFVKCVTPPERYAMVNVFKGNDSHVQLTLSERVCPYVAEFQSSTPRSSMGPAKLLQRVSRHGVDAQLKASRPNQRTHMRNSNGPGRFQPNNNPQAQGPKHSASSSPLQAPASDPIDQNLLEASPNDPIRSSPSEAATSEAGKTTANSDAEPVKDASDVSAQTPAVSNYVAASHVRPHSAKDVDKESFTRSGERADDSDY